MVVNSEVFAWPYRETMPGEVTFISLSPYVVVMCDPGTLEHYNADLICFMFLLK